MDTTTPKVFDLDAIRNRVVGRVKMDGVEHDVHQPIGRTIQGMRTGAKEQSIDRLYAAVRQCVPTLPEDAEFGLTPDEAEAILTYSSGRIAAVEAIYPNAFGPVQNDSISPG